MAEKSPPYWVLITVLASSLPLDPTLAMTLYQAALDLFRNDKAVGQVAGDMISGRVTNLKKDLLLGSISGPAFEAEIDTARGHGKVNFLLTRQGLELTGDAKPPRELMN